MKSRWKFCAKDSVAEREASERRQQEMETADTEPFAVWLEKHA
ncbi:hypothetical protein ACLK1S_16560 [Escherichia coli]